MLYEEKKEPFSFDSAPNLMMLFLNLLKLFHAFVSKASGFLRGLWLFIMGKNNHKISEVSKKICNFAPPNFGLESPLGEIVKSLRINRLDAEK